MSTAATPASPARATKRKSKAAAADASVTVTTPTLAPTPAPSSATIVEEVEGGDSDNESVEPAPKKHKKSKNKDKDDSSTAVLLKRLADLEAQAEAFKALQQQQQQQSTPAAAAAAGPMAGAVVLSSTPIVETLQDEDGKEEVPMIDKFLHAYTQLSGVVGRGLARVKNPDLALALVMYAMKNKMHYLNMSAKDVLVTRTFEKVFDNKTKKFVDGTAAYINFKTKFPQSLPTVGEFRGLTICSPFCHAAYLNWGPTEELGVNGTVGRVIKGNAVPAALAQYQLSLSNKAWTTLVQDDDFNNPVMSHFFEWSKKLNAGLLTKVIERDGSIPEVRKKLKGSAGLDPQAFADAAIAANLFKTRFDVDEDDPTVALIGMGVSVYRPIKKEFANGKEVGQEDLSDYTHPSPMFKANEVNKNGKPQVHNQLPLFRFRRVDELEAGVKYDHPYIRVPDANAALTSADVVAVVYSVGFYEWQLDKCGITNKPVALLWLNKEAELKKMSLSDIQECDPRHAMPMAGHYKGPLDYAAEQSAAAKSTTDANGNFSAFANDPDHADFASSAAAAK